jgi:prepilin-type N-terminal cleavage/methylation domain-containing protein
MEQTALRDKLNNKGMTLIEMLIALVIILITTLAMMSTALLGIQTNMINSLRDEAVGVADERMTALTNIPFPTPPATNELTATGSEVADATVVRTVRASAVTFTRTRIVADVGSSGELKQVTVTVTWSFKGKDYTHRITSILKRQEVAL